MYCSCPIKYIFLNFNTLYSILCSRAMKNLNTIQNFSEIQICGYREIYTNHIIFFLEMCTRARVCMVYYMYRCVHTHTHTYTHIHTHTHTRARARGAYMYLAESITINIMCSHKLEIIMISLLKAKNLIS